MRMDTTSPLTELIHFMQRTHKRQKDHTTEIKGLSLENEPNFLKNV
jgi:hypothetical protein